MTEDRTLKLDEVLEELYALREQNHTLENELFYFKSRSFSMAKRCKQLAPENQELKTQVAELNFSNCLNGKDFARSFGVGGE